MSTTVKNFYPLRAVSRLTPLVMAIALISPFSAHATEAQSANQLDQAQLQSHQFHQDHVLGTSLDVVITGVSKQQAKTAYKAIESEIARLDKILSTWRDDSEISQLNREKNIQASPELFEVIAACETMRHQTCGAFDARLGQLIALWEKSQGIQKLDQNTRAQVIAQLDQNSVSLDQDSKTIAIDSAVKFAPDAYAKGYIIDRALAVAREKVPAIQGLLVDIGGDMRVWGQAPNKQNQTADQQGWSIGVQSAFNHFDNVAPDQVLNLKDQAIAFSGKGYRNLAGQSHLLDPKTGAPLQQVEQCVVVGQCAAQADALATALAAMTPSEGLELIDALVGYESKLTTADGQVFQSNGWNNLVHTQSQADMLNIASSSSAKWPAGYQAVLDLNIPKLDVEKYRAPYVVVWVTDKDKKIVRTLAVWGKDEKWINTNYVWWRRYGRQMTSLDAVAKPSRQPGNYKLAWDGKDDHGKPVAAGQYQVHIETAREHGDHSYQTINLDVKAKPSAQTLAAQKEIGTLKLNFQKVN
ncbi:DUF2271 domain-containing protein [Acinetobacter shaoyimingii]|nr:DUF2271 domain-containing protein [Acinetobacter shaoyimingii]